MYFEDDYPYTQDQTTDIVKMAFLSCMKKTMDFGKNMVTGNELIESALKKLNISSFDFLNDNSILKVEKALSEGLAFLVESQTLSSEINTKDQFYKFFVKKQLFSSREFSNEFDDQLVLQLLYKLDFSFHYIIAPELKGFYKTYLAHLYVLSATKLITVHLPKHDEVRILVLPKSISSKYLKRAITTYDYTPISEYIAFFNEHIGVVNLFTTKVMEDNEELLNDLTVAVNVQNNLKNEFLLN